MTKQLTVAAEYTVTIRGAHWQKMEAKNGDNNRMMAVLPGYVTINGEECFINGELLFVSTIIQNGRNAGQCMADINNDLLASLGMETDATGLINPANLTAEMEGKPARFVCAVEEYNGNSRLRVKFINPPGREAMEPEDAKEVFAALVGKTPRPPAGTAAPSVARQSTDAAVATMDKLF